jgi:hypothetical protein
LWYEETDTDALSLKFLAMAEVMDHPLVLIGVYQTAVEFFLEFLLLV